MLLTPHLLISMLLGSDADQRVRITQAVTPQVGVKEPVVTYWLQTYPLADWSENNLWIPAISAGIAPISGLIYYHSSQRRVCVCASMPFSSQPSAPWILLVFKQHLLFHLVHDSPYVTLSASVLTEIVCIATVLGPYWASD